MKSICSTLKSLMAGILGLILWLSGCNCASANAAAANDSLVNDSLVDLEVKNVHRVYIHHSGNNYNIRLVGRDNDSTYRLNLQHFCTADARETTSMESEINSLDFSFPFTRQALKKHWKIQSKPGTHFAVTVPSFGFVTAVSAPKEMDVNMGASFEIMWDMLMLRHTLPNTHHVLEAGLGLDWRQYRMTGQTRFAKEDGNIVLTGYPEGADVSHSRLKIFSLYFPLRYNYYITNRWAVSAGVLLHLNTRASIKSIYTTPDDGKVKDFHRGIHQRRFTTEFIGKITYKGWGVYAKYSPFDVLESDFGPSFKSLSVGLCIGL